MDAFTKRIKINFTVKGAETLVLFCSLLRANIVHVSLAVVKIYALVVQQALLDVNSIKSHWRVLLQSFPRVIVSHVGHGCNKHGHKLAD